MRIIAGAYKGRPIKTVEGPGYRPAMGKVREALFSMLEARGVVWSACAVCDLFAGSGSLGFEALSRGALNAAFIELAPKAVTCLQHTRQVFGLDAGRCRIVQADVVRYVRQKNLQSYDVVFIDPPYGKGLVLPILRHLTHNAWLSPGAWVTAEVEAALPITDVPVSYEYIAERCFGQTRIIIWKFHPHG